MTMTQTPFGHALFLLTEVTSAAEPRRYDCCADTEPCADHADDQEGADLLAAIRDAAMKAADEDDAGREIARILRGGKPAQTRQPTLAQREFAISAMRDAARWLLGADEDDAAVKDARHRAADAITPKATYEQIGIAVTGGVR